ncbi:DUF4855 domain-containing protein [Thermococcus litoralis]|uniref:DUF4855 domain-containing protein n=1 Tax=Thermococcus litoralis TaxID=2265 RepID=UPI000B34EAA2|nr:DUF4855 domain-containing protein [Thermococcus litoralis]
MATFGLWYFKWNDSSYESRLKLTLGGGTATVQDFKNRGFDYAVAVGRGGEHIEYSGNGYHDGRNFAEKVLNEYLSNIPYYATIPYYKYQSLSEPRDNPSGDGKYWSDWIDGILSIAGSNLRGFYWSQESAWMIHDGLITLEILEVLSTKINDYGLKFIWIPHARTKERDNTDDIVRITGASPPEAIQ